MDILDNVKFVNNDLSMSKREEEDRNIKFRLPSFEKISGRWNRFRYKKLVADMEKKKEKLINQNYEANGNHQLTAAGVKNLKKNATAIAKLEEKILILAKENVPKDYVKRRAIKLKRNMMDNLSFNARSAYIVGANIEKRIFDDEEENVDDFQSESGTFEDAFNSEDGFMVPDLPKVAENVEVQSLENGSNGDVNVVPSDSQRMEMSQNISKEFEKANASNEAPDNLISPEEVMEAVNGAYNNIPDTMSASSSSSEDGIDISPEGSGLGNINSGVENEMNIMDGSPSNVNTDEIKREDVLAAIEEQMNSVLQDGASQDDTNLSTDEIGRVAIEEVIGKEMDGIPTQGETLVNESFQNDTNTDEIGRVAIEEVIGKEIDGIPTQGETLVNESSQNGMNNEVFTVDEEMDIVTDEAIQNVGNMGAIPVENEMVISDDGKKENVYISKNGTAVARTDRYDENGELKIGLIEQKDEPPYVKFDYSPMTDEEIAQARENIEYDKYEEKYDKYKLNAKVPNFNDVFVPVGGNKSSESELEKYLPIVVPERGSTDSFERNNGDQNIHFDYTEATAKDLRNAVEQTTSLEDAELLMARAMQLREKQKETKEQMEENRRKAEEVERKRQEVENAAKAKLERLRVYNEAVEEDCAYNEAAAKQAEEIAAENVAKIKANEDLMNEIDSIIGGEAINVSVRGR